jgi:protein TonB
MRNPSARLTVAVAFTGALSAGCGGEKPIDQPTPLYGGSAVEYPLEMWDAGIEGETVLRVLVNAEGEVDRVEILESSGVARLDSAAVAGARAMKFTPARRDGKRIPVWAEVPVEFTTNPNARRPPGGG